VLMVVAASAAEVSAVLSTAFAAVAAWAAVSLDYKRESRGAEPWLAGNVSITAVGEKRMNHVNAASQPPLAFVGPASTSKRRWRSRVLAALVCWLLARRPEDRSVFPE
jgi:hypothetical protein